MGDLSEMDARAAADRGDDSDEAVSELQCRELFRNIREGFFVGEIVRDDCGHAIDFIFRSINAAFTDQTGLTADEAIGRRVTDAIPGLQRFLIETYGKVVDTGRSAAFEVEIPALANRSYEARAHSLGGERFAVLFLEITRRKRAEKALEESRTMLSDIVETVDQIVWSARPDGYHDFFNRRWYEFTGSEPGTSEGDDWANFFHPDDRARTFERWKHSLATGEPYEIEYRALHRSGEYRWLLGRAHPVRNEAGKIIRWMGTGTDIEDAKRAEASLRASEEQFRTMADSLPQLAWMADPQGWIYWYNRRWYEYTGTKLEEMEGWGWRKVHHPDHVARVVERIQQAWTSGEPWEDVFPLRGADGEYRWFLSRAVPIRDADGRIKCWFGTNTDITEQRKIEEFQQLLIREISHRVKNSLALVSALLHLQARNLPEESKAAIEDAATRVHTVAAVHDQLFRQSDAREIDLKPFLSNLVSAIAASAPEHEMITEIEPASVSADMAVPIGLLINELVTNAFIYAYPDEGDGKICVTGVHTAGHCYRLEVRDRGQGLPEGFSLERQGTSLGMRILTSLSKQLGGTLKIDSAEPGTCFALDFALRQPRPLLQ